MITPNLNATSPTLDRISNGPMYLGANFPFLPNLLQRTIHFYLLGSAKLFYRLKVILNLCWIMETSLKLSTPIFVLTTVSHQYPLHIQSISLKFWMVLSDWPSVWGWKVVLKSNLVLKALCNTWSINSCSSFIIDLLSVLTCAKLPADFLFKALATTFAILG